MAVVNYNPHQAIRYGGGAIAIGSTARALYNLARDTASLIRSYNRHVQVTNSRPKPITKYRNVKKRKLFPDTPSNSKRFRVYASHTQYPGLSRTLYNARKRSKNFRKAKKWRR